MQRPLTTLLMVLFLSGGGIASTAAAAEDFAPDDNTAPDANRPPEARPAACTWPASGPSLSPRTEDLTSNRFDGLPRNRLQVTVWYDGAGMGQLGIHFLNTAGNSVWAVVDAARYDSQIETREYDMTGLTLTGIVSVQNVVPNGAIDGLAFGLFWKDGDGRYHQIQSSDNTAQTASTFVGAWPTAHGCDAFRARTPQLTDGNGRAQAMMMVYGARYLDNGCYQLALETGRRLP